MANFTDDKKKAVWQNAKTVDKFDPDKFRQDACPFVGKRSRAVAGGGPAAIASAMGSWKHSDFPDAVPVAMATDRPARM